MKILVCDKIDPEVLKELSLLGQITDISNDNNKDLIYKEIVDSSIVVIRSATTISKDLIVKTLTKFGFLDSMLSKRH